MCAFTLLQIYYICFAHTKFYRGNLNNIALKSERDHNPNIKDCDLELMSSKLIYFNPFLLHHSRSLRLILMLNYGIFTNFLFCRFCMKKESSNKKSRKIGQGNKLCRDIALECRDIIPI